MRMGTKERAAAILGIRPEFSSVIQLSQDNMSARFAVGSVELISNKKVTPEENPAVVSQSQAAILRLPDFGFRPGVSRNQILISINPELFQYGVVSSPGLVSARELATTGVGFFAIKKVNLADFAWVFDLRAMPN